MTSSIYAMLKIVLLLLWVVKIHALAYNITITSDSALIAYIPQTSWTRFFCGQTRRSHMKTTDPDAYALITYRFHSFSFLSHMQPYPLRSNITVDEISSVIIDFQDYTASTWRQEMDVNMVAQYSAVGDQVHTIRVSVPESDISTLVDQIIFEVNDDSDASTPGTEDTSSFVVAQVYRTDEISIEAVGYNHDPRTLAFPELRMLYPRNFHLSKGWALITGILLTIAYGIAAVIALVILWCIGKVVAYLVSKLLGLFRRRPTLPPNSGPMPMVVYGPLTASPALNLDGVDPPPSLVIGDGSDATATGYVQLPTRINNPPQLAEDGALLASEVSPLLAEDGALLGSEVSPLLGEPEAGAVNLDSSAQQSQPSLETPSSVPLDSHAEGSNVAKEILYGDGSDGPKPA